MKFIILLPLLFGININAQNTWQKLNGPLGCAVAGLIAKGDTIIVGTGYDSGIIFFSADAGDSWEKSNIKVPWRFADFVFSDDGAVLAAANSNGIYKSYDLVNWTNVYNSNEIYWSIGKDRFGNIFTGSDMGQLLSSTDNGNSWSTVLMVQGRINKFELTVNNKLYAGATHDLLKKDSLTWGFITLDSLNSIKVVSDSEGEIFAYDNDAIQKSTDEGLTWIKLDTLGFFLNNYNYVYNFIYNHRLIAGLNDETGFFGQGWGIGISDDGGYTWYWSNNGLPPKFASVGKLAKSGINTYIGTNAAGVFKSTDFGESWFPVNNGITAALTLDITFDSQGNPYTANWSNGIQKSTDNGNSWEVINNGLTNSYLYSIIADDNDNLMAGTDQGMFISSDFGNTWLEITGPGNEYGYHMYKDSQNRIYVLTYGTGIYRTTDLGNSWTRLDQGFISSYTFGFAIDGFGNMYAGTRGGAIYKSTDDGVNWSLKYLSNNSNSAIGTVSISPNGTIFAGNVYEGVLRSTNDGDNWELVKADAGSQLRFVSAVNEQGEVFVSGSGNIFSKSTDNGDTWIDITDNLTLTSLKAIKFDSNNRMYLCTDESVWTADSIVPVELLSFTALVKNNNATLSWTTATETNNIGFEIERQVSNMQSADLPDGSQVGKWDNIGFVKGKGTTAEKQNYTFTDKNLSPGKYQFRLKQIDFDGSFKYSETIEAEVNNPLTFSLEQNYPNPFNPTTTISWQSPVSSWQLLKIYDVLGNEVKTLVNEFRPAGKYEIKFDGSNLASGIYFYRLIAGKYSSVKKLILLK